MSPLPQLILWYGRETAPALPEMADYRLRTYQPGDEEGWLSLLQANGELGRWDRQRLEDVLEGTRVQLFIEYKRQIVACAGCNDRTRHRATGDVWEIGSGCGPTRTFRGTLGKSSRGGRPKPRH